MRRTWSESGSRSVASDQ